MKLMRRLHLYLGCFFAPMLLLFTISGALQTFSMHRGLKNGTYHPPAWVATASDVHMSQRLSTRDVDAKPSPVFRWFVLVMSAGLAGTVALGVIMALKSSPRPWTVWAAIATGIALPAFLLFAARGFR